MVDWISRLCNMAFESGVVPEDKGEMTECRNYRGIDLLIVV